MGSSNGWGLGGVALFYQEKIQKTICCIKIYGGKCKYMNKKPNLVTDIGYIL